MLKSDNPVLWAINAAYQDASYLISPRARQAAIDILWEAQASREGLAALAILRDGGTWQSLPGNKYASACSLSEWTEAAETLGAL